MSSRWTFWAGAAIVVALGACTAKADFVVTRRPVLDYTAYPQGNRVAIGSFGRSASDGRSATMASRVRQYLQDAGSDALALDKDLELVASGGGLTISGTVTAFSVETDRDERADTCRYRVNNEARQANCTRVLLSATVSADTQIEVRGADGSIVYSTTISRSARGTESGTVSSVSNVNNPPHPVDIDELIDRVAGTTASVAGRTVFAWSQTVRERFSSCHGDERCTNAVALAQAGRLVDADEAFSAIVDGFSDPIPAEQTEFAAKVYRNRGIVRRYSSDYDGATADLTEAIRLMPSEVGWRDELDGIRAEASGGMPDDAREPNSLLRGMFRQPE